MNLADYEKLIKWEESKEDNTSYYFLLTDTFHHCTYDVVLIKDTGDIMVNGDKIDNMPRVIQQLIMPRITYFLAEKRNAEKKGKK